MKLWLRVRIITFLLVLGLVEDKPDTGWSVENA